MIYLRFARGLPWFRVLVHSFNQKLSWFPCLHFVNWEAEPQLIGIWKQRNAESSQRLAGPERLTEDHFRTQLPKPMKNEWKCAQEPRASGGWNCVGPKPRLRWAYSSHCIARTFQFCQWYITKPSIFLTLIFLAVPLCTPSPFFLAICNSSLE